MISCNCRENAKRHGKDRNGNQRYRCRNCGRTFVERDRPLGDMRIGMDKAAMALGLLLEGMSIRATERLTGLHRDTLCSLVATAGEQCETFLRSTIRNVQVEDVEADEVWGFVGCKEKTRQARDLPESMGDAYCWVAIERNTKLVITWLVGKRSSEACWEFIDNLYHATDRAQRFQVNTDGYRAYQAAVPLIFQFGVDFAQIIKRFGGSSDSDDDRRYSPANIIATKKTRGCGSPDLASAGTSRVERWNLSLRMHCRRMTRLTNAHSKKWENHSAMLALYFAWYNYCRPHLSLGKRTPAMAHGLADHRWSIEELLRATGY